MQSLLPHTQKLVYTVLDLMPSGYQRRSLEVLLSLFLEATGKPLPAYSELKSGSALNRFLNHYRWPVRQVIRTLRQAALERLLAPRRRGRRPILEVVIDLTCLEKAGRFKGLNKLIHVLNGKRGRQVVILYLCVDGWRIPWGFRVWRGKGQTSYVFKVAITDSRIVQVENDQVTFRYRQPHSQRERTITLHALEFIRRFLQHVLPSGLMKVCYYGFLNRKSSLVFQTMKG